MAIGKLAAKYFRLAFYVTFAGFCLLYTNLGLKFSFWLVSKILTSSQITYDTLDGRLIDNISITNLTIADQNFNARIKHLSANWDLNSIVNNQFRVNNFAIKSAEVNFSKQNILINQFIGKFTLLNSYSYDLKLDGSWNEQLLTASADLTHSKLTIGNNSFATKENTWKLNLNQPKIFNDAIPAAILANGTFNITKNNKITGSIQQLQFINSNLPINIPLFGTGTFTISKREISSQINFAIDNHDSIDVSINLKNFLKPKALKINSHLQADIFNLKAISPLLPGEITNLTGHINLDLQVSGYLHQPIINLNSKLNNASIELAEYDIKIQPFELDLISQPKTGKLFLTGTGGFASKDGEFYLSGNINPWQTNNLGEIKLHGKNLEFVNLSNEYQLFIEPNLTLSLVNLNNFYLDGDIVIAKGKIQLKPQQNYTVKSQDVVMIDEKNTTNNANDNGFSFKPNVNIKILKDVFFSGYDIKTNIEGEVKVYHDNNNLLGAGEINLINGSYEMPGQNLTITRGKLFFPNNALLSNPELDIKMQHPKDPKIGLYIHGSIDDLVINETGFTGGRYQAFSKALQFGSSPITDKLQDALGLSEISIQQTTDNYEVPFFEQHQTEEDSLLDSSSLVIGKQFGKRFYLQFMQGLGSASSNILRLKYSLSKHWAIGIEASDGNGSGADLSFIYEQD